MFTDRKINFMADNNNNFLSSLASPFVSAGSSLLGGVLGGIFGNYQQKKANEYNQKQLAQQFEYNRQLAQQAYDLNLQQWRIENEYNSPTNQMARLREAGINPHLAYSHGTINNVASSSPSYNSPSYGFEPSALPDISGSVLAGSRMFSDISGQIANNMYLGSQKSLADARALETLARIPGSRANSTLRKAEAMYAEDYARQKFEQNQARIDYISSSTGVNKERVSNFVALTENIELKNDYDTTTLNDRIYTTSWRLAMTYQSLVNLRKDGLLKDITYDRINEEVKKLQFLSNIGYSNNDWLKIIGALVSALKSENSEPSPDYISPLSPTITPPGMGVLPH